MNAVFNAALYAVAALLLGVSYGKDRDRTALALKRAWGMFAGVLPQFAGILLLVGLLLALLPPESIRRLIGAQSGLGGMLTASLLGAVALVPVLIAFPIAAELLKSGAGVPQIAVFVSTLTMVGLVTLPMEARYLGKKAAALRNALAFLFALFSACILGEVLA